MAIHILIYLAAGAAITALQASLISYQTSKALTSYPAGYETNDAPVRPTPAILPSYDNKLPHLQDPAIFSSLKSTFYSKFNNVPITTSTEIIDQTDSDEIEPDTEEAKKELEREIELLQTYHIDYYQQELDRIAKNQSQKTTLSKIMLEKLLADSQEEMRLLNYDFAIIDAHGKRHLSPDEQDFIKLTVAERLIKIKADQLEKTKKCECTIAKHIHNKIFRRNMSDLSADYQAALSGASWERSINPDTGKESVAIGEWLYDGPAGKADFDGWIKIFCLLLEMKANYDSLMFSRTKISALNGQPELKRIGRDKLRGFRKQAAKHNEICMAHAPTARCCWIFMTQFAYNSFIEVISKLPAITAIYVPLDKALL